MIYLACTCEKVIPIALGVFIGLYLLIIGVYSFIVYKNKNK